MMALLANPALAGMILVASGPSLPHVDVRRTCAQTAAGDNPASCISEENYARKKLVKYWGRTPAALKRQCVSAAQPPAPSYIVLRDCINNGLMVKQIRKQP